MILPYDDTYYMKKAMQEAETAFEKGEVPIGAVVVIQDRIIARAHNLTELLNDVTAHAEMQAITAAANFLGGKYLKDCTLYVTLEPCPMCATAISFARIQRVYYGAYDPKGGGVDHGPRVYEHPTCHHAPEVYGGIREAECAEILKTFFLERR